MESLLRPSAKSRWYINPPALFIIIKAKTTLNGRLLAIFYVVFGAVWHTCCWLFQKDLVGVRENRQLAEMAKLYLMIESTNM